MKTKILTSLTVLASAFATPAFSAGADDPLLGMLNIDALELRDGNEGQPLAWEIQGWLGYDLQKLVVKTDGERINGETENAELQLLYSQAISPYWDLQTGVRHDFQPAPNQSWAVIGTQGLAPYFFETDISFAISDSGQTNLRLSAEYELMLTQRWVLSPEVEINLFGKDDASRGIGQGLSDMEAGIRLRYEVRREFAPYIGINWEKKWGNTADYAREEGEATRDSQFVLGIRAWF